MKMIDRRKFVKTAVQTATGVAAATLLADKFSWAAAERRIDRVGLQLYTVRDLMKADFDGHIAAVRISSRRWQTPARCAPQRVRRQSGEDGNGLVLDHRRRGRPAEIFQSLSRTLSPGSRQGP